MLKLLGIGVVSRMTLVVSTGSSNTGFSRIVNQTERRKFVMKNPPHTAHISHSRLNECRLVLSGTRALPLWTRLVFLVGKFILEMGNLVDMVLVLANLIESISVVTISIELHLL